MENEKEQKRGKSLADMGLVSRDGMNFIVKTPSLRGRQVEYEIKMVNGKVVCDCLEFEDKYADDGKFLCDHIYAVKEFLVRKT